MPSKNPAQRLRDILENIEAIEAFTEGLTFEAFVRDRKTVYAVTRALEIISGGTIKACRLSLVIWGPILGSAPSAI